MLTSVDSHAITVAGRLFRIARVRDEPYQCVDDPEAFVERLKESQVPADLFTFMQEISEPAPKYPFYSELDSLAVLPITNYETWWKQIGSKTRNMVRKAHKTGVEFRSVPFDDALVTAIMDIYNESQTRQGKPFTHYAKPFEVLKKDHETFLSRSDFIGAFYQGEMIGFIKFVVGKNVASLMQIISKLAHRDKAPNNALIAKAVEICADKRIPLLHYGSWSTRTLGIFKTNHGFVQHHVPRYYIPLNLKGCIILKLRLHRDLPQYIPEKWLDRMTELRNSSPGRYLAELCGKPAH